MKEYANRHPLIKGLIKKFPFPNLDKLEVNQDKINDLTERLWTNMRNVFDEKTYG